MTSPDELYRRYASLVLRRCRSLLKQEDRALDAMQDVFVQVLRHGDRLKGARCASFLQTIANHVCLNYLRSEKRSPAKMGGDEAILRAIASESSPEFMALHRSVLGWIFRGEPTSTATMAVLHFVDGLTHEEVAREVGMSVSGVRKRLRTLQARLAASKEV